MGVFNGSSAMQSIFASPSFRVFSQESEKSCFRPLGHVYLQFSLLTPRDLGRLAIGWLLFAKLKLGRRRTFLFTRCRVSERHLCQLTLSLLPFGKRNILVRFDYLVHK